MAAPRVLPSDSELAKMRERGMSLNQICDEVERQTGYRPARSSVSAALSKAGLTNPIRYDDFVPWTIASRHRTSYVLYMLRVGARLERSLPVRDGDERRYRAWKDELDEKDGVVDYDPATVDGFLYRRRKPEDGNGIVRRPTAAPKNASSKSA